MNRKFFFSAIASGLLAVAMGGNAVAASIETPSTVAVVDNGKTKDVVLEAGTDPASVQLHFAGAQVISFVDVGTLKIQAADGSTWKYRPTLYQTVNGKRRMLTPGFRILGKDRVGLSVSGHDPALALVLGPVGRQS